MNSTASVTFAPRERQVGPFLPGPICALATAEAWTDLAHRVRPT